MQRIPGIDAMREAALRARAAGTVALVPTMGALHEGHLDLVRRARELADTVVVSVFVNPSQFGPAEDFTRYPRDLDRDAALLGTAGCDILFHPAAADMYPAGFRTWVSVDGLDRVLEGAFRPDHFRGVTTVVAKLFHITLPHVAVFGQKDAQQAVLIRRMTRDLDFGLRIEIVPTRRDGDGVALSSRNAYLSDSERIRARAIPQGLDDAARAHAEGVRDASALAALVRRRLEDAALQVDYVACSDAETLESLEGPVAGRTILLSLAARAGATRLIDNILLTDGSPHA